MVNNEATEEFLKELDLTEEEIVLTNEIAEAISKEPKVETHEVNINFIDVLPIIPNPHNLGLSKDIDPLSLIYSKFITQLKLVNHLNPDKKEFGNPIVSLIMNYKT